MDRKTEIVILTHGGWGSKLVESLKMVFGEITCVHEIPLLPQYTFAEYYQMVEEYLADLSNESVVLTDIFGGTTSNVAAKIGHASGMRVISGLSAPLLLEACSQLQYQGALDADKLLEVGRGAAKDVVKEILSNMGK